MESSNNNNNNNNQITITERHAMICSFLESLLARLSKGSCTIEFEELLELSKSSKLSEVEKISLDDLIAICQMCGEETSGKSLALIKVLSKCGTHLSSEISWMKLAGHFGNGGVLISDACVFIVRMCGYLFHTEKLREMSDKLIDETQKAKVSKNFMEIWIVKYPFFVEGSDKFPLTFKKIDDLFFCVEAKNLKTLPKNFWFPLCFADRYGDYENLCPCVFCSIEFESKIKEIPITDLVAQFLGILTATWDCFNPILRFFEILEEVRSPRKMSLRELVLITSKVEGDLRQDFPGRALTGWRSDWEKHLERFLDCSHMRILLRSCQKEEVKNEDVFVEDVFVFILCFWSDLDINRWCKGKKEALEVILETQSQTEGPLHTVERCFGSAFKVPFLFETFGDFRKFCQEDQIDPDDTRCRDPKCPCTSHKIESFRKGVWQKQEGWDEDDEDDDADDRWDEQERWGWDEDDEQERWDEDDEDDDVDERN